jgi:hypothetical protein
MQHTNFEGLGRFPSWAYVEKTLCTNVSYFASCSTDALQRNQEMEFQRNKERFQFLKWGAKAFHNMLIVPPGSGIVHQVNSLFVIELVSHRSRYNYCLSVIVRLIWSILVGWSSTLMAYSTLTVLLALIAIPP